VHARDLDTTFVPRRSDAAFTVEIDGEAVILDEARNRLHHLNPTAGLVWACFDGTGSIDEIAHDLASVYGASGASTSADVLALARELAAQGLLDGVDRDPEPGDPAT
jgi:hypothetical protein